MRGVLCAKEGDLTETTKVVKAHFNTQMHKKQVNQIEERIDATKILRDGATMRCARICYHLFKKGRPFSDFPELVAPIVAGGTFMGGN